jgi:osmotically inducible protein OsmC
VNDHADLHQPEIDMSERKGFVQWQGRGKEGQGRIGTESGALKDVNYGFATRFEDDRRGTNPEELIAAAHASCFTMAFSFACDKAGFATETVETSASVRLVSKDGGFAIDRIALEMRATVPGIDEAQFQQLAAGAKAGCPVSKALARVPDITLKATLVS